jgi:uncharacterized lipoprotein
MKTSGWKWTAPALAILLLGACATKQEPLILSKKGAVELRSMQSRVYETADEKKVYRAVIATFQDLGYSITKVEPAAGMVGASKLAQLRMTATVFKRSENRVMVRSNAIVKLSTQIEQGHQVDSAEFYQKRFFEPLSKALFLTALQVQDPPDQAEKVALKRTKEIIDAEAAAKKKAEEEKAKKKAEEEAKEQSKQDAENR